MSCPIYLSAGTGDAEEEATFAGVRETVPVDWSPRLTGSRFMADKIMPMSQALEGYELFDKMAVQKVVFEAEK